MIRQVVNGDQLLLLAGDDAIHVLLQFVFELGTNQILPPLHGKNDVNINLRVGVGHRISFVCWE